MYQMSIEPYKAIIFDMDGVLVNTEPHHIIIEKRLFASLGLNISEEEHRSYLGKSSVQMWKEIISKYNLAFAPEHIAEKNSEEIIRYFSGNDKIEIMGGIERVLEELFKKGIPMALASSSDPGTIDIILSKTGLGKYFLHKISCKNVGRSKPDPDIYLYAAGLLSVKPGECIVIEDSFNGIKAAKSAGMYCIAFEGGMSDTTDQSLADESIADFSLLPELLLRLRK
jgi:beta-phosphoglucomutase